MKRTFFIILISFFLSAGIFQHAFGQIEVNETIEPPAPEDRILILAPHPDDETIGCAGLIQQALKAKAKVRVVYLTNGDHNAPAFIVYEKRPVVFNRDFVAMGKLREREAKKAMRLLGLGEENLTFLGYPDYGTDTMFLSYWDARVPFRSYLTRQAYVPYKESPSYHAPYRAENVLKDIQRVLLEYKPTKIFVSHPADSNGDHWAYYCFLQIALRDLRKEVPEPKLYVYFVHAPGWPIPRHYHPQLPLLPSEKHFPGLLVQWKKLVLTPEEIEKKYAAMLCYRSQTCVSAFYLLSFVRQNELFGDYPLVTLKNSALSGRAAALGDKAMVSYGLEDNCLLVRIKKPEELRYRLFFSIYIFGYSDSVPFDKMPNICVKTKYNRLKIIGLNTGKEISPEGASAEVKGDYFMLKIPLKTLGGPDFLLACAVTDKPFLPLDATGFRRIEIQN